MTKLHIGVGFHTSSTCYCDGIGAYLANLANGGHIITAKSVDSSSSLMDFQNLIVRHNAKGYGIYRCLQDFDVPNYGASLKFEAERYVDKINRYWPSELDKSLFYVELVNECDKNQANWLGYFMCELGRQMMDSGYNFCGPGWSPGEPEPEHNRTPGMLAWFELVASRPGRLAHAVHEYAFDNTMESQRPWQMGRVADVNAACIENGIPLPDILITEFGWSYQTAPGWQVGVPQIIDQLDWYLANTPNVKAVHIWALDKSSQWADISTIINPYMTPLVNQICAKDWEQPKTPVVPPIDPPLEPPISGNMIKNPSFELGWIDRGSIQIPNLWDVITGDVGTKTSSINQRTGEPSTITGSVEATHKNKDTLPPDEWPDGSNPLIADGDWSFKLQAVNMVAETWLEQHIIGLVPLAVYEFSIKAKVHYHPDAYSIGEPDDIHVNIMCGLFDKTEYLVADLPDRAVEWTTLIAKGKASAAGTLKLALSWENYVAK